MEKKIPRDASAFLPDTQSLPALRIAAADCRGCELFERATQTVFGEGESTSKIVLVGEQPGDKEDLEGHPFVGPAGRLLTSACEEAGINRANVYITNAVKHFKWEPRGKKRMHLRPHQREVTACKPWLESELDVIKPRVIVCLGATAAQAFLGNKFRITQSFGKTLEDDKGRTLVATYHPSAILRMRTDEERDQARQELVAALVRAKEIAST